jgi:hypothetical protein
MILQEFLQEIPTVQSLLNSTLEISTCVQPKEYASPSLAKLKCSACTQINEKYLRRIKMTISTYLNISIYHQLLYANKVLKKN